MKRFKDLLNEFKTPSEPPKPPSDSFGEDDNDDAHWTGKIHDLMRNVDYSTIIKNPATKDMKVLKFANAFEAAAMVAKHKRLHQLAKQFADDQRDFMMSNYHNYAVETHNDILDDIRDTVASHIKAKAPQLHAAGIDLDAIDKLGITPIEIEQEGILSKIEGRTKLTGDRGASLGSLNYIRNKAEPNERGEHPHLENAVKHIQELHNEIQNKDK